MVKGERPPTAPAALRGHGAPGRALPLRPPGAPAHLRAHGRPRVPVPGGGEDGHVVALPRRLGGGLHRPLPRRRLGRGPGLPAHEPALRLPVGGRAGAAAADCGFTTTKRRACDDLSFPPPRAHRPHRLCALTGDLATEACERVAVEWLRAGDEPRDACRAHLRLLVDARSGRPASRETPRAFVEPRTFVDLPPRYAAWAAAAGLPRPPAPEAPVLRFASFQPAARVRLTSPTDGLRLLRDPETPPDQATLSLAAVVDPPGPDVVFYVDGVPSRSPRTHTARAGRCGPGSTCSRRGFPEPGLRRPGCVSSCSREGRSHSVEVSSVYPRPRPDMLRARGGRSSHDR